ncbi:MAG: hypothetical protein AB7K09_16075 [Planctomycetota bacterium]
MVRTPTGLDTRNVFLTSHEDLTRLRGLLMQFQPTGGHQRAQRGLGMGVFTIVYLRKAPDRPDPQSIYEGKWWEDRVELFEDLIIVNGAEFRGDVRGLRRALLRPTDR